MQILENQKSSSESDILENLKTHIKLEEYIPREFYKAFYKNTGRPRGFSLESLMWYLIAQSFFKILDDAMFLSILPFWREMREFIGFGHIPDAGKIVAFKQTFVEYIGMVFEKFVDATEPICQAIDPKKSGYLIYDPTGIEAPVKENNPKFINSKIKNAKKAAAKNPEINAHVLAYSQMPEFAEANPFAKQQFINGYYTERSSVSMLTKQALYQMGLALYAISLSLTMSSNAGTPKSSLSKLTILPLIKKSPTLLRSTPCFSTFSSLTRIFSANIILFLVTLLSIPMMITTGYATTSSLPVCAFLLIIAIPTLLTIILMKMVRLFALKIILLLSFTACAVAKTAPADSNISVTNLSKSKANRILFAPVTTLVLIIPINALILTLIKIFAFTPAFLAVHTIGIISTSIGFSSNAPFFSSSTPLVGNVTLFLCALPKPIFLLLVLLISSGLLLLFS